MLASVRRPTATLLPTLALTYAALVLAWQALRATPLARWWPFELLNIFAVWLYAPLPGLILLAAVRRRPLALAALTLPLLAFAVEYGQLFLPNPAPPGGPTLRVMSANLLIENAEYGPVVRTIVQQRPDVLAVQELSPPMADRLAADLREQYPFQALYPSRDPIDGLGLLSRHPLRSPGRPETGPNGCYCQQATVVTTGREVTVINVHPRVPDLRFGRLGRLPVPTGFRTAPQEPILRSIIERVERTPGPLLLVGDFNVSDRQGFHAQLRRRLRDAHREAGWGLGYTFPSSGLWLAGQLMPPLMRLDYVYFDESWSAAAAWNGALAGSDHRFVAADLVAR